jgi:hypothetical protein
MNSINRLGSYITKIENTPAYLPIDEKLFKIFNARSEADLRDGNGVSDINYLFEKLIPDIKKVNYENDNIIYKLFGIQLRPDKGDLYRIQNICFRGQSFDKTLNKWINTRKEWFTNWLGVLKNVDRGDLDIKNRLDRLIYETIFDENGENIFKKKIIDLSSDEIKFSQDEIKIADLIQNSLVRILGRYTFQKLYNGEIFPKLGLVRFISYPWVSTWDLINKETKFSINLDRLYKKATQGKFTPHAAASDEVVQIYQIYRLFLPYSISLIDNKGDLRDLSVHGIPNSYSILDFYKNLKLEALNQFDIFSLQSSIFKAFNKYISNKFSSASERYYILKNLMQKILYDSENTGSSIRSSIYDWLASKGSYTVKLYYYGKDFVELTPNDYKFFENQVFVHMQFLQNLYPLKDKKSLVKNIFHFQKDFFIKFFDFLKNLSNINQGKKIVLYPFKAYKDGFGLVPIFQSCRFSCCIDSRVTESGINAPE